jgi:hypothetical protein
MQAPKSLSDLQIARAILLCVNIKMRCAAHIVWAPLLLRSQALYVREEAGTQRYNVGTDSSVPPRGVASR